jgi:quercetin dioxygenase-like cupin family protein
MLRSIVPAQLQWRRFAAFPPAARLAILLGHPDEPGLYVIRVKLPSGERLMPHRHPENRIYTVMSGTFYIGTGERFDPDALVAYPVGSVVLLPGGTWHFHWARSGEYVTQVMGVGPLGIEYLDLQDDPRVPR